jgi:hypothetical protein
MKVYARMTKEVYEVYIGDMYAKASERSGCFAKIRAKAHKKYDVHTEGTKADRAPKAMKYTIGKNTYLIMPADMTKTGKIKKSVIEAIRNGVRQPLEEMTV